MIKLSSLTQSSADLVGSSSRRIELNHHAENFKFSSLPSEMKALILLFLPTDEILNFGCVSKSMYDLVAPRISDSLEIEENVDEYSIDIWTELSNRLQFKTVERVGTLKDCKKLFLKLFLEKRVCRSCHKTTPDFKSFLRKIIVKPCYCDGYICRKKCLNAERMANESISRCSKCKFVYNFHNPEKIGIIPKVFNSAPVTSQLVLTAISSISCILFVYSLIASFGYVFPPNPTSEVWLELENFWFFKQFDSWKYFVNGMSIISFIIFLLVIVASLFGGGGGGAFGGNADLSAMEGFLVLVTIGIVVAVPIVLGGIVKNEVIRRSILGCKVAIPKKDEIQREHSIH